MSSTKILIVDDEPIIVNTVRAYLEPEGYTVYTAADGPAALRAARSFRPDLVVLDLMLPGLDGIEVLRRLRQESDVYVLILTAKGQSADRLRGFEAGADEYLAKPFDPTYLVSRAAELLGMD